MIRSSIPIATASLTIMPQHYTSYGAPTSVDELKSGIPQAAVTIVPRTRGVVPTESITNPLVPLEYKRPRLGLDEDDHLEASVIYSTTTRGTQTPLISEYSQRRAAASTPSPSLNPLLSLSHHRYGLPEPLVKNLASMGVNSIYPWQSSCLLGRGLLAGEQNLVYSAPTGGGKSLVAEVLMLKQILEKPTKKALLVLPYVALVQEKLRWLRRALEGVSKNAGVEASSSTYRAEGKRYKSEHVGSVRAVGFFGGSKTFCRANWKDFDVAVCTFEKVQLIELATNSQNTNDFIGEQFSQSSY